MKQEIEREAATTVSDRSGLSPISPKTLAHRGLRDLLAVSNGEQFYRKGATHWEQERYNEAVECFARGLQCEPNHPALLFYLGLAYYQGVGVPSSDLARAVAWWHLAAQQGCAQAQNNLGRVYEQGEGVQADYARAVYWYRRAADQHHATAQYNLGVTYELGRGVARDLRQAATWYQRAAEQGYAPAQYNLGGMLRSGRGLGQDLEKAASWYRKAAQQNYAPAQFNLAVMHEQGEGVREDLECAAFWYHKAEENGDESARRALGEVLTKLKRPDR